MKEEHYEAASATFAGSGIQLTRHGRQYLGSAIESDEFTEAFVKMKIEGWINEIEQLSLIAKTHPHAVYAAYTHGLGHKWKFLLRTIPNIGDLLTPLETTIRHSFLPSITGKNDLNNHMRRIMALPTLLGGLGLDDPQSESKFEYSASCNVCHPISGLILQQSRQLNSDTVEKQRQARLEVRQEKRHAAAEDSRLLLEELPDDIKRMVNLAAGKGASNWLSVLPVAEHGFYLHKTAFRDAICLRFGWRPDRLPEKCICGSSFTVKHALTCNRGGFSFLRHNEIRDLSAKLLTDVCPCVGIEPELQPLSGETLALRTANRQDEARVDIRAQGFWGERKQDAFFDVRVFNPHASSNRLTSPSACYKKHEKEK